MCGIFGWMTDRKACPGADQLVLLTDKLVHRGPDGAGTALLTTRDDRHSIGLGHRRLSIVDLSDQSSQPMWTEDGALGIVFNGEIYNYVELKGELAQHGVHFESTGDTEVLLQALRLWGIDALPRLRGMFAFALYDRRDETVLLARDGFGKKPLFLGKKGDDIFFSSEIAPLLEVPGFAADFNQASLGPYLLDRYVSAPQTFFTNITKLEPGCYAVWKQGKLHQGRFYTNPLLEKAPLIGSYDEGLRLFEASFDEAVRIRMRSDVPVGAFLSGGLDSSAVVAYMCKYSDRPIKTFSVDFAEAPYSEGAYAKEVSEVFGTEHHELTVSSDDFFAHWDEAIRFRGAPVAESSDIPIMMLARNASRHVTVVLTGEGADEMFGGYPKYAAEHQMQRYARLLSALNGTGLVGGLSHILPTSARRFKIMARTLAERDIEVRKHMWFGGLTPLEAQALLGRAVSYGADETWGKPRLSPMRALQLFDQTHWLPDNLLERGDRMLMASSVEGRMPFMDVELAALAARLPESFMTKGGTGKRLIRDVMAKQLPERIIKRRKHGFRVPIAEWLRGKYKHVLRDTLEVGNARIKQVLDGRVIDRLVKEHIAGDANHERLLWSLCNLERFMQNFNLAAMPLGDQQAA